MSESLVKDQIQKIDDETYFATKALSSHHVMSFFFPQSYPKQNPKFFQEGTYVHAWSLEDAETAQAITDKRCPDLDERDKAKCDAMIHRLAADVDCAAMLARGDGVYTESAGYVGHYNSKGKYWPIKGKFDLVNANERFVLDVKTTSSLKSFDDSILKFAYQIQAAFYLRLASKVFKAPFKDFYWAVVDKKTLATKLIRCDDEYIKDGNHYIDLYLENPPTFLPF
jgi:hypothetical protein